MLDSQTSLNNVLDGKLSEARMAQLMFITKLMINISVQPGAEAEAK